MWDKLCHTRCSVFTCLKCWFLAFPVCTLLYAQSCYYYNICMSALSICFLIKLYFYIATIAINISIWLLTCYFLHIYYENFFVWLPSQDYSSLLAYAGNWWFSQEKRCPDLMINFLHDYVLLEKHFWLLIVLLTSTNINSFNFALSFIYILNFIEDTLSKVQAIYIKHILIHIFCFTHFDSYFLL